MTGGGSSDARYWEWSDQSLFVTFELHSLSWKLQWI